VALITLSLGGLTEQITSCDSGIVRGWQRPAADSSATSIFVRILQLPIRSTGDGVGGIIVLIFVESMTDCAHLIKEVGEHKTSACHIGRDVVLRWYLRALDGLALLHFRESPIRLAL
jgi:hypothetical protein